MIVTNLTELLLYPVAGRGIPNSERLPILVREYIDIGRYGLMIGSSSSVGAAVPYQDNLFWFGGGFVSPGDWIMVYTGGGVPRTDDWPEPPGSKVYSAHWGRDKTIFANSAVVPILFRVDAVDVGLPQDNLPQTGNLLTYK